jgi:dihydroneopterin aldolase
MSKKDVISLTGIRARGFHGVLDFEREQGQEFVVDVALSIDLSRAGRKDDLAATVNYAEVAELVVKEIQGSPLNLIEALAERIARQCLNFSKVTQVSVTVHKPQAPIAVPFEDVAVTVVRKRKGK